jgi:hypothetical protein
MTEMIEGLPVRELTTPPGEIPGPRGQAAPTWRAPMIPGRDPNRIRVPVQAKEVRPGALARAIQAREQELQRGGTYLPAPEGLRDHAGRPVHLPPAFLPWDVPRPTGKSPSIRRSCGASSTRAPPT